MSQENLAVVRRMYEALATGNIFTFSDLLDPGIEWVLTAGFPYQEGNPYVGREAVGMLFVRIMQEWKRFKINAEEFFDAGGDTVIALGHYSAICRATGKPVNAQFAHVGTLRDGKVVRYRQFADTVQFARAASP
jgi:uncharacterized protein